MNSFQQFQGYDSPGSWGGGSGSGGVPAGFGQGYQAPNNPAGFMVSQYNPATDWGPTGYTQAAAQNSQSQMNQDITGVMNSMNTLASRPTNTSSYTDAPTFSSPYTAGDYTAGNLTFNNPTPSTTSLAQLLGGLSGYQQQAAQATQANQQAAPAQSNWTPTNNATGTSGIGYSGGTQSINMNVNGQNQTVPSIYTPGYTAGSNTYTPVGNSNAWNPSTSVLMRT